MKQAWEPPRTLKKQHNGTGRQPSRALQTLSMLMVTGCGTASVFHVWIHESHFKLFLHVAVIVVVNLEVDFVISILI